MSETSRYQNDSQSWQGQSSKGRLLSEHESAALAGVSIDTIRQFRGCGLLETVKEAGEERFREIDIKTLFYNRTRGAQSQSGGGERNSAAPDAAAQRSLKDEIQVFRDTSLDHGEGTTEYTVSHDSGIISHTVYAFPQEGTRLSRSVPASESSPAAAPSPADFSAALNDFAASQRSSTTGAPFAASSMTAAATDPSVTPVMPHFEDEQDTDERGFVFVDTFKGSSERKISGDTELSAAHGSAAEPAERKPGEFESQPNQTTAGEYQSPDDPSVEGTTTFTTTPGRADAIDVTDGLSSNLPVPSAISADHLIEMTKGLREQIQILREERDWLRARVEKLETRSEREQMLLLSESENIRKLIQQTETRKSWLRALPWFKGNRTAAQHDK